MLIKSELISRISRKLSWLPEKELTVAVNAIIKLMSDTLSQGGRIEIRGFGSFCLHFRPPRRAHNPKTGEKLITQPKYAVHFKPGKEVRAQVNASRHIPLPVNEKLDTIDNEED